MLKVRKQEFTMSVHTPGLEKPSCAPCVPNRKLPAHREATAGAAHRSLCKRLRLLLVLGWCLLIGISAQAQAQPQPQPAQQEPGVLLLDAQTSNLSLGGRSQYWVDSEGSLSVEQIDEQHNHLPMQVFTPASRFDLSPHAALWIRFESQVQDSSVQWELELARSGTDRVNLYHRDAAGRWVSQQAGDSIAVAEWANPDRFPVFALSQRTDVPVTHWVRIAHARVPFSGNLVIHSHNELREQRAYQQFLLGAYFGLALLLSAIALVNALVFKDSAFASYALYTLLLAAALSASLGIGGQYLWPRSSYWAGLSEFILLPLAAVAGLIFVRHVVQPSRVRRWLDLLVLGVALLMLGLIIVDTIAPSKFTLQAMSAGGAAAMVMVYAMVGAGWRAHDRWVRWIGLGILPVALAGALPILRNFGVISTGWLAQYGMVIAAAIEAPLLMFGLLRRFSILHEAQTRASALKMTEPLTGLSNRHNFMVRLHDSLIRAMRYQHQCALLLIDLDNHDGFALEHGREVADRALVLTGSRLRSVARDVDTAARVGNHEFALLMEGPVRPAQAVAAATSIVAAGLRPSVLLPAGTSLRFKVVVALLPDPNAEPLPDAQAQIDWMHIELMGIDADRRKTIQTLNF
jgi:two-component system, sensor histidine kinase LadS